MKCAYVYATVTYIILVCQLADDDVKRRALGLDRQLAATSVTTTTEDGDAVSQTPTKASPAVDYWALATPLSSPSARLLPVPFNSALCNSASDSRTPMST